MDSADEVYQNPVDKKTYVAPGGWKTYRPESPRPVDPKRKIKLEQVRLLTSETEMAARTTVSDLSAFIEEAERLATESLGKSDKPFRVMVQFNCKPMKHDVQLAHQGGAAQELLQSYHDAIVSAKPLPLKDGEVSFQIELSVTP